MTEIQVLSCPDVHVKISLSAIIIVSSSQDIQVAEDLLDRDLNSSDAASNWNKSKAIHGSTYGLTIEQGNS